VHVMTIAGMPPRRLGLVNARDAYLSIADRAVRDAALRMMRERFGTGRSRRRRAPRSVERVKVPAAKAPVAKVPSAKVVEPAATANAPARKRSPRGGTSRS